MKCGEGNGIYDAGHKSACPIANNKTANGLNGGVNGGRICWVIADSCCNEQIPCITNKRKDPCFSCEFRYKVMNEEGLVTVCRTTGKYLQSSITGTTVS